MFEDPFDDFRPKPRQSVFVGHHNFFDHSSLDLLQKPRKAFPFVVEAGADVFEDLVGRVLFLELGFLALEVIFLLRRRDSTVDRPRDSFGDALDDSLMIFLGRGGKLVSAVSSMATNGCSVLDFSSSCPVSQCSGADTEGLRGRLGTI